MARRLETSSDDWHKFNEKADKIQRKHSAARTSDEREKWKRKAEELIDYMRDKYGYLLAYLPCCFNSIHSRHLPVNNIYKIIIAILMTFHRTLYCLFS